MGGTLAVGAAAAAITAVAEAIKAPTMQIVANCGVDGPVVVSEILERGKNIGYDASKGEYVDMIKAGIIDPAKVSRSALQNAASVAGLLLTTDLMITDIDEKSDEIILGAVK